MSARGDLYSWGLGAYGQLGHGDAGDKHEPTLVEGVLGYNVTSTSCGLYHSAAVTKSCNWEEILGASDTPAARHRHASAIVDGVMHVFGGLGRMEKQLGDMHVLNVTDPTRWRPLQTTGQAPSPRSNLTLRQP